VGLREGGISNGHSSFYRTGVDIVGDGITTIGWNLFCNSEGAPHAPRNRTNKTQTPRAINKGRFEKLSLTHLIKRYMPAIIKITRKAVANSSIAKRTINAMIPTATYVHIDLGRLITRFCILNQFISSYKYNIGGLRCTNVD
jgi:hypothetical protein